MAFSSGIRASGSGSGEYTKKILLKDTATYGPWKAKLTSILDAEDCWDIVNGREFVWGRSLKNACREKWRKMAENMSSVYYTSVELD